MAGVGLAVQTMASALVFEISFRIMMNDISKIFLHYMITVCAFIIIVFDIGKSKLQAAWISARKALLLTVYEFFIKISFG